MYAKDYKDIWGGAALVLIGGGAAIYAITHLRLGTVSAMGPGMFPAAIGIIIATLGLFILVPAFFRAGPEIEIDIRSALTILASVLAFAVLVRPFGIIPAITAQVFIASLAGTKLSLLGVLIQGACLALGATALFRYGLNVALTPVAWPW